MRREAAAVMVVGALHQRILNLSYQPTSRQALQVMVYQFQAAIPVAPLSAHKGP
ncbi:MAG: hypothetical protein JOZ19_06775 [Rubrobacter sp.]|nr:hypothetical protein [Rubrobacter sp.]